MRNLVIGFMLAASIGAFRHRNAVYVPPSCMDHIRFTKPCVELSASLCTSDHVEVTFHCVGVKKELGKVSVVE